MINQRLAFAETFVFDVAFVDPLVFVNVFAVYVVVFALVTTTTLDGRVLTSVETFASLVTLAFVSTLALAVTFAFVSTLALASTTGADSVGVSPTVSRTEMLPVSAGIAKSKADSIKTTAAAIVIFDKIVCEPRG